MILARLLCLEEHDIINWQIRNLTIRRDLAGVGQNKSLFHMIIFVLHEGAQRAVDGVILAGLNLDRNGGQAVVVVDQIIDLALVAVIVIK